MRLGDVAQIKAGKWGNWYSTWACWTQSLGALLCPQGQLMFCWGLSAVYGKESRGMNIYWAQSLCTALSRSGGQGSGRGTKWIWGSACPQGAFSLVAVYTGRKEVWQEVYLLGRTVAHICMCRSFSKCFSVGCLWVRIHLAAVFILLMRRLRCRN